MIAWYAINTKPHKERQVQAFLAERGIEIYLPLAPNARQRKDRPAVRAYFPGYLFAHADLDVIGEWTLRYCPGARGLVRFGDRPGRVDDRFIDELRARLAAIDVVDKRGQALKPGDQVVITSGAFADWQGIFDKRLSPAGRVRVLLKMMKHWASVELDVEMLRKDKLNRNPLKAKTEPTK
jgi:transcriptional antiterminator RfaH